MIRAGIDTNVLVSGLGWPGGPPAEIVAHALHGSFVYEEVLIVTPAGFLDVLGV